MRRIRGSVAAIAFASIVMVSTASPAVAVSQKLVVGHAKGTAPFTFDGTCEFVHQHFLATIDTPGDGDANLDVDVCVTIGSPDFPATGSFTLETGAGTLEGSATGFLSPSTGGFAFTLVVGSQPTVVGQGSALYFRGIWKFDVARGEPLRGRLGTQKP